MSTDPIIEIEAAQLVAGDVIADTAGGPAFTVAGVDRIGPLVIVDFANGTSTPPIPNHITRVHRKES